jgi:hypothetical protein
MTELQKAMLGKLDAKGNVKKSDEVPVQFNPATLKLQRSNSIDMGKSRGRQVQQYNGTSSTILTLDLEFDTADADSAGKPVDVRTLTQDVTKFVLPGGKGSKQAPPRVRFRWGQFVLAGVMTSATEDLDLFSADGVPLRAKVSVSIKEQDPKFEALASGPGANPSSAAGSGSLGSGGPGTSGRRGAAVDRVAEALDGESASDFLARQGLEPSAWRSIAQGLSDVLSMTPGEPIGFNIGSSLGGFSVGSGAELEIGGGLEASLGLDEPGSATEPFAQASDEGTPGSGPAPSGFALAAAGGLTAAVQTAAGTAAAAAADNARTSFTVPSRGSAVPAVDHRRLRDTAGTRTLPSIAPASRPAPPQADSRATSYGSGIPLRDRITPAEVQLARSAWVVIGPRSPEPSGSGVRYESQPRYEGPVQPADVPRTYAMRPDPVAAQPRPRKGGCSCR